VDWFRRHLSWTAVLCWIAAYPLGFIVGMLILSVSPYMSTTAYYVIVYLIVALWTFGICAWVLREKNRSYWYLLWLVVPFGWIVFLSLENRAETLAQEVNNG
jgi:hypothetical protein